MKLLHYLGRRFKTAWQGVQVCREPWCGRKVWDWREDVCEDHRGRIPAR
jgi:hypothetical protein